MLPLEGNNLLAAYTNKNRTQSSQRRTLKWGKQRLKKFYCASDSPLRARKKVYGFDSPWDAHLSGDVHLPVRWIPWASLWEPQNLKENSH